ncbi:hypothetical protein [Fimbriiglobus ruber]|uniref:Uncharacterized protein n=1 Tax=Fimbriiglobus ruber TaxID=1908690 RepID=A0A225DI60_9BACT|nr:hypothetical protein [Fimbriiglobus ruber]OWK41132.1 hypothetical protein FRUB_05024 [Fimbriiglobus ruber]
MPWWRSLLRYWKPFLTVLVLPVAGNVFAGELRDLVYTGFGWKDPAHYLWWTTGIAGALVLAMSAVAVLVGRDLFRPHNIALGPRRNPHPHPHVVLFLSNLNTAHGRFDAGVPDGLSLSGDLDADLRELVRRKNPKDLRHGEAAVRWPWEMSLRGLFQHRGALRSVTLVCSRESLVQAHWFARLLTDRYAAAFPHLLNPDHVRLLVRAGRSVALSACPTTGEGCAGDPAVMAWDFEDYDELYGGLVAMMDQFAREGTRDTDVMVDVTGGQKPNSVVGALLTVNRRAKFQYVQTNTPNEVIAYDLMTDPVGN